MSKRHSIKMNWTRILGQFWLLTVTSWLLAQEPGQAPLPPSQTPAGAPARPVLKMPKAGVCPLPILPALPAYTDTAFYTKTDVPHGKLEQAKYKNYRGVDKRMHVYLPPAYDSDSGVRYPVLYLNHGGGDDDSRWSLEDQRRGGSARSSWTI